MMISRTTIPIALWSSKSRRVATLSLLALLTLCGPPTIAGDVPWATTFSGEKVRGDKLLGQPTLLILTPYRNAAEPTREWVTTLRSKINQSKSFKTTIWVHVTTQAINVCALTPR
ncbi:MAG: hypothetical protein ACI9LY_000125 [Arenicella sp.]|jgi:hypothetical protein